jgi:hypothetical protein
MVFECEPKEFYEYFVTDKSLPHTPSNFLKMEAEGFSERLVHRHVPEDWYVQGRRCLIAAGIVGCLTKRR